MKISVERSIRRKGKKVKEQQDDEEASDRKKTNMALAKVRIQEYVLGGSDMTKEDCAKFVSENLSKIRPSGLDNVPETQLLWETCIEQLRVNYPIIATREKPQDFTNNSNNINKFFGNKFGNILRSYVNNLGIYYAGKLKFSLQYQHKSFITSKY